MSRPLSNKPVPTKVQEFLDFQRTKKSVKDSTIKNQKSALLVMSEWKPLPLWKADDVTKYIIKMKDEGYSEFTIEMRKALIKAFFVWIGKEKLVNDLEIRLPKRKLKSTEILLPDDVNKMIAVADDNQMKALLSFMFESGARISEILNIKVKDLKEEPGLGLRVLIPATKTGEDYRPCLCISSAQYIRNHVLYPARKQEDPLFDYNPVTVWSELKRIGKKAGIDKPLSAHKFRHAQATYMTRKGYQESIIRKKLGWTDDSQMIARYTHLDGEDVINATAEKEGNGESKIPIEYTKAITTAEPIKIADPSLELSRMQEQINHMERMILDTRTDMLETIMKELGIKEEQLTDWIKLKTFQLD